MPISTSLTKLPISFVEALDIGKQSRAGALGLLIYDYLITFSLEVDVVWTQSKRSPLCWLYLFDRFFPLFWLVLDIIPFSSTGIVSTKTCVTITLADDQPLITYHRCIIYLAIDDCVIVISTLAVQVILQLRVYALYQKSRRIRLFLTCCWLVEVAVMAIFIGLTFADIKALPVISTSTGCYYSGIFSISALFWLPALVYEPVLCLMVLWKVHEEYWLERFWRQSTTVIDKDSTSGKLVKAFARDSLIYFLGVFIELLINTVIWSHYNRYINVVVPWSGALPSILGSRLFLRMREAILFPERYSTDFYAASSGVETTVRFIGTSRPIPTSMTQTAMAGGSWEGQSKAHGTSAL